MEEDSFSRAYNDALNRDAEAQAIIIREIERAMMFKLPKVKPRSKDFLNGKIK